MSGSSTAATHGCSPKAPSQDLWSHCVLKLPQASRTQSELKESGDCVVSPNGHALRLASEVKRRWRQQQISSQLKFVRHIDSTWRKKQIPTVWCGWLRKRCQGIFSRWTLPQERLFELRRGATDPLDLSSSSRAAVLRYNSRGHNKNSREPKQFTIISAKRDSADDWEGWACISISVSERKGGLKLFAANEYQAQALLTHIHSTCQSQPVLLKHNALSDTIQDD